MHEVWRAIVNKKKRANRQTKTKHNAKDISEKMENFSHLTSDTIHICCHFYYIFIHSFICISHTLLSIMFLHNYFAILNTFINKNHNLLWLHSHKTRFFRRHLRKLLWVTELVLKSLKWWLKKKLRNCTLLIRLHATLHLFTNDNKEENGKQALINTTSNVIVS